MTNDGSARVGVTGRPGSVIWYERLAWASIAIGLMSSAANPANLAKYYERYHTGFLLAGVVFIVLQFIWIWLVARKRQNWARWISLVVVLIGIPNAIWDIEERFQINPVATVFYYAAFGISIISVMLLFRNDAGDWFSRKPFASAA